MCFYRVVRKILEVWNLNIAAMSVYNNDNAMMMARIAKDYEYFREFQILLYR